MTQRNHYTFGDTERAARRLQLLSSVFEEPSRALLERYKPRRLELALDLGAGPGHTTRLVHEVTQAFRTIGVEASEKYVQLAQLAAPPGVELFREDVTAPSGALPAAGLVFCRFLLTHVADPASVIRGFRRYVAPDGVLLLQETAHLAATHPALARYYELVSQMQTHYGQILFIGQELLQLAEGAPFRVLHSGVRRFERPAAVMAELHVQNLRTWRNDTFALRSFDAGELDELEQQLSEIAAGQIRASPVALGLGELVLG